MSDGYGRAYGAVTILNAFATGIGAALGINTHVEARVKKSSELRIETRFNGEMIDVDTSLVKEILNIFTSKYGLKDELNIFINSYIPPERGLKSSSAVANALIIALFEYLGIGFSNKEVLRINVDASRRSGVSITGALDDAAASLLGGIVITNNKRDEIIGSTSIDKYNVLIIYPEYTIKTIFFAGKNFSIIRPYVSILTKHLLEGDWRTVAVLNGLIYSTYLGLDAKPIYSALESGAYTAGLSGKGPAYFSMGRDIESLIRGWRIYEEYRFIKTTTR